jgi:ribosomal protein S27AE
MNRLSVEWQRANPEKMKRITRRWRLANPEKNMAHRLMKGALRRGEIVKAESCEDCGAGGVLHGHHEDYSRPLNVTWLCPRCHAGRR